MKYLLGMRNAGISPLRYAPVEMTVLEVPRTMPLLSSHGFRGILYLRMKNAQGVAGR
jgi:hypothetical protein